MVEEELTFEEFLNRLTQKVNGRKFKTKIWSNYPESIFYYWANDEKMQDEIAIYTAKNAWGIFI